MARARSAFQYPVEIPVATINFLRTALNAQRKARGEEELQTPAFMKETYTTSPTGSASRATCCAVASMSASPA